MPRATDYLYSFNAGEWSPACAGRIDLQKRRMAVAKAQNFIPLLQGAMTRRPGTWFVEPAKVNSDAVRLVPFIFSVTQAYVLEFTANAIRFFTNDGQLLNGGSPYEVATTYGADEVSQLGFTQSADVLYITHPLHAPAKLERLGATNWVLTDIDFQDGPYLGRNISDTYISSSATYEGSTTTLTANNTHGINGGAGFLASDVGRLFRIGAQSTNADGTTAIKWVWGVITAVTDTTHATGTVKGISPQ
jgi:hypothetical protein